MKRPPTYLTAVAIGIIWLFHISGLLGIFMGFESWFIPKTPVNLLINGILFLMAFPVRNRWSLLLFLIFAFAGMAAEWIGVHTGWLFGEYAYGDNLGPKLYAVPLLIGLNWAVLGMICGAISKRVTDRPLLGILLGACLMTGLDMAMEPVAPLFDFWSFSSEFAPLKNYICWFGLSFGMQWAYWASGIEGNFRFSLNLLLAQLVFFVPLSLRELLWA